MECAVENCTLCAVGNSQKCDVCSGDNEVLVDGTCGQVECEPLILKGLSCDPLTEVEWMGSCASCLADHCLLCFPGDIFRCATC